MMQSEVFIERLSPGAEAFTRRQARSFEQAVIDKHGLNQLDNARNEIGISASQPKHIRQGATAWARWMLENGTIRIFGY